SESTIPGSSSTTRTVGASAGTWLISSISWDISTAVPTFVKKRNRLISLARQLRHFGHARSVIDRLSKPSHGHRCHFGNVFKAHAQRPERGLPLVYLTARAARTTLA